MSILRKLIKELQEQNTKLTETNQTLELRLERSALKGDYDPRLTKVIHFEENPFSEAVNDENKKMDELIEENMKLKEVDN